MKGLLNLLNSTTSSITNNEIITHIQMIRLNRLKRIHSRSLRLTDHLNLRPQPHTRSLSSLQCSVLCSITPNSRTSEYKLNFCRRHERLAVPTGEGVHCVLVNLS